MMHNHAHAQQTSLGACWQRKHNYLPAQASMKGAGKVWGNETTRKTIASPRWPGSQRTSVHAHTQ